MVLERKHLGEILNVFFLITLDREEALVLHIWNSSILLHLLSMRQLYSSIRAITAAASSIPRCMYTFIMMPRALKERKNGAATPAD